MVGEVQPEARQNQGRTDSLAASETAVLMPESYRGPTSHVPRPASFFLMHRLWPYRKNGTGDMKQLMTGNSALSLILDFVLKLPTEVLKAVLRAQNGFQHIYMHIYIYYIGMLTCADTVRKFYFIENECCFQAVVPYHQLK